jgi:hypothetical protein
MKRFLLSSAFTSSITGTHPLQHNLLLKSEDKSPDLTSAFNNDRKIN